MSRSILISNLKALLLPFTVIIIIPILLLNLTRDIAPGWDFSYSYLLFPISLGGLSVTFGLYLMMVTIRLFITVGKGTLAPWEPVKQLIIEGPYRYVRNPMITGVLFILFGEALISGSFFLLGWFFLFGLVNHIYIIKFEEPELTKRFGDGYILYRENVPRWIPRLSAWKGIETTNGQLLNTDADLN